MDLVKDKNILVFLQNRDIELFNYYREAPKELQKSLKALYSACYRFNLNNTQTLFIISEVIKPYRQGIMIKMLGDDEECLGKVKHKEDGEIVKLV